MRLVFLIVLLSVCSLSFPQTLLGPEEFNSDVVVHGSSAPTTVWFAPNYYTPLDYSSSGGCSGGHVSYQGSWNNYWMNFLRTPAVNCTGLDTVVLCFKISNSWFSGHPNDKIYFNMWIDGGYHNAVTNQTILFDQVRDCQYFEVSYDLTPYIDKSGILFYFNVNCAYNDGQNFFVKIDSISLRSDMQNIEYFPVAGQNDTACGIYYCFNDAILDNTGNSCFWTVVSKPSSGSQVLFTDSTILNTCLTINEYGTYEFVLNETDGTNSGSDTVEVEFLEIPVSDAGTDQFICGLNTAMNATGVSFPGFWLQNDSIVFNNLNDPATNIDALYYGAYYLVWTSVNFECQSSDTVSVIFDPCSAIHDSEIQNDLYLINIDNISNSVEIAINNSKKINKIEIFSQTGLNIFERILPAGNIQLYLSNGFYIIVIYSEGQRFVRRIFV